MRVVSDLNSTTQINDGAIFFMGGVILGIVVIMAMCIFIIIISD